jgi:hypothetical protein
LKPALRHAALAVGLLAALKAGSAAAQNNGQYGSDSKFAVWYSIQYSKINGWCCSIADGHRFDGVYDPQLDGSVILRGVIGATDSTGAVIDHPVDITVDVYKVLDGSAVLDSTGKMIQGGPNPTGHAVLWSRDTVLMADGGNVFCFSPGPLG